VQLGFDLQLTVGSGRQQITRTVGTMLLTVPLVDRDDYGYSIDIDAETTGFHSRRPCKLLV